MTDTYRDLPPAQALVMEVLAARARLGEGYWTFSTRHRHVIAALELRGLVASKSGNVERTCVAWLTDAGREATLSATYKAPALAELDDLHWLIAAGHDVQVGATDRDGGAVTYVRLLEDPETTGLFGAYGPVAEGLRAAREWSEREGITP